MCVCCRCSDAFNTPILPGLVHGSFEVFELKSWYGNSRADSIEHCKKACDNVKLCAYFWFRDNARDDAQNECILYSENVCSTNRPELQDDFVCHKNCRFLADVTNDEEDDRETCERFFLFSSPAAVRHCELGEAPSDADDQLGCPDVATVPSDATAKCTMGFSTLLDLRSFLAELAHIPLTQDNMYTLSFRYFTLCDSTMTSFVVASGCSQISRKRKLLEDVTLDLTGQGTPTNLQIMFDTGDIVQDKLTSSLAMTGSDVETCSIADKFGFSANVQRLSRRPSAVESLIPEMEFSSFPTWAVALVMAAGPVALALNVLALNRIAASVRRRQL